MNTTIIRRSMFTVLAAAFMMSCLPTSIRDAGFETDAGSEIEPVHDGGDCVERYERCITKENIGIAQGPAWEATVCTISGLWYPTIPEFYEHAPLGECISNCGGCTEFATCADDYWDGCDEG
jgi:hypothetical protein